MTDFSARRTTMVDTQVRPSDVTKFPIIDAMLSVPRERFVPAGLSEAAYIGDTLDLGDGRFMLEPRTFAKMLDSLAIEPSHVVLDIGCGLGYSTAVLSRMAEFVVGTEEGDAHVSEAQSNLTEQGYDNAVVVDALLSDGAAKSGPYDIIIIEGGVEDLPDTLLAQLKEGGGRIAAIFLEGALGEVRIGHKIDGDINWRFEFNALSSVLPGFEASKAFAL